MLTTMKELVLASASPRRKALLLDLGVHFTQMAADIDENFGQGEDPEEHVLRLATEKCTRVMEQFPARWVLAADTIVYMGNDIFGKPESNEQALDTLMLLSGKTHNVATAFRLGCLHLDIQYAETVITEVSFAPFTENEARAYVQTGEPNDKAGAYGIQGMGGVFVRKLRGSYSNVVGLPLWEVITALNKYGIVITKC